MRSLHIPRGNMLLLLFTLPVFLVSLVLCLVSFDRAPRAQVATLGLIALSSLAVLVAGIMSAST